MLIHRRHVISTALGLILTPMASIASAVATSQIPRLEKERDKLKAYINDPTTAMEDERVQSLMADLHDIEDRIAAAPCRSRADAVAKLKLVAQADQDGLQGWEGALCAEVIGFLLRH